jgi:hypothetical protein
MRNADLGRVYYTKGRDRHWTIDYDVLCDLMGDVRVCALRNRWCHKTEIVNQAVSSSVTSLVGGHGLGISRPASILRITAAYWWLSQFITLTGATAENWSWKKAITFWELALFPSAGDIAYSVGSYRRVLSPDDGSRARSRNVVASFLVFWTMDQFQRNTNTVCDAASEEPFRAINIVDYIKLSVIFKAICRYN